MKLDVCAGRDATGTVRNIENLVGGIGGMLPLCADRKTGPKRQDGGRSMIEGGCNCGAIRYRIEGAPMGVAACHCIRCRRQSGGTYSVNLLVSPSAMTIQGAPKVFTDRDTSSGAPVYREFCGECGSPIRSVLGANPDMVAVKAGTLDDPDDYAPGVHVFTRSKIAWVDIPLGTPQFAENPG